MNRPKDTGHDRVDETVDAPTCRYFPKCRYGNVCHFWHPTKLVCKDYPECRFGNKCWFHHENPASKDGGDSCPGTASRLNHIKYFCDKSDNGFVKSGANSIKKMCYYWPYCKYGVRCCYRHPLIPCKYHPNCPFGRNCFFNHSVLTCKYGSFCLRTGCTFLHPIQKETSDYVSSDSSEKEG